MTLALYYFTLYIFYIIVRKWVFSIDWSSSPSLDFLVDITPKVFSTVENCVFLIHLLDTFYCMFMHFRIHLKFLNPTLVHIGKNLINFCFTPILGVFLINSFFILDTFSCFSNTFFVFCANKESNCEVASSFWWLTTLKCNSS